MSRYRLHQLVAMLSPKLPAMNLSIKKAGGDYEISRILPFQPYILNPEESERLAQFFAMRTLPSLLQESIEHYISKKVGKDWDDPVILDRLRRAIIAQKDDYWKPMEKRSLQYTKAYSILGYLAYHFPVYFIQTEHLLSMLARDGLLKKSMTILDIGTSRESSRSRSQTSGPGWMRQRWQSGPWNARRSISRRSCSCGNSSPVKGHMPA